MKIRIKKPETDAEIRGKAYVHWKAWHEAYTGLIDPSFLDNFSLERCENQAFRHPNNVMIATVNIGLGELDDERVIGFVGYGKSQDEEFDHAGEIFALYILEEFYDRGVGARLFEAAMEQMKDCDPVVLRLLEGNERAAKFYEKQGFRFDGKREPILLGTERFLRRMVRNRG